MDDHSGHINWIIQASELLYSYANYFSRMPAQQTNYKSQTATAQLPVTKADKAQIYASYNCPHVNQNMA